jgi:hypothetical protein
MPASRLLPVLAATTVLALAACGSAQQPSGSSSGPPTSSASTAGGSTSPSEFPTATTTRLTFVVRGCEGCELVVWNGRVRDDTRIIGTATVASGTAAVSVATADTVGLAIQVNHPKHYVAEGNTVPVVVLSYGSPGAPVTAAQAAAATSGQFCWAGTTGAAATLTLATSVSGPFPSPQLPVLAVWADPSLVPWAGETPSPTFHGAIGIQDSPWCTPPGASG